MSADDLDSRTSDAVRAILELEDAAPDAVREILPGTTVPFWAQVRVQVAWNLSAQQTGSVAVESKSTWSRRAELSRVAKGYLPDRWDAVRRARPHEVCFYVSGATLSTERGRARNWLVDDFAEATGDAVVVQARPLPAPIGAPLFRPTLSMESATARSRWRARGTALTPGYESGMKHLLAEFARLLGQPRDAFSGLGGRVLATERLRPFQQDELERMLDRMRPRIVVYDNGSYTYNSEPIGLMKDAGAYVVEPQHGWIGPSHPAYNFGKLFDLPELRRGLPDEVLTFGSFWTDGIRHPGRVTSIGKPHLERQAALAGDARPQQVLVVSSRTDPAQTDAFVVQLRAALPTSWAVVFRPHPGERAQTAERYPQLSATDGVVVDVVPDVYESLSRSRVVIGEASTVLFEARAFGCHVIARESAFAENVIGGAFGERVDGVAQAVERLNQLMKGGDLIETGDPTIWAPDAIGAYRRWLGDRRAGLASR